MHKIIARFIWINYGLHGFTGEVNDALKDGWSLDEVHFQKRGLFRTICCAILSKGNVSE